MKRLVVLTAMVITMAGCGSGTSTIAPVMVNVGGGTWSGAVSVKSEPDSAIFSNYSVRKMSFPKLSGVNIFGSYSTSMGGGSSLVGTVTDYVVALTGPGPSLTDQPFTFPFPFITPAGCTLTSPSVASPAILTNDSAGTDILLFSYTGTYDCSGTAYTATWVAPLYRHIGG